MFKKAKPVHDQKLLSGQRVLGNPQKGKQRGICHESCDRTFCTAVHEWS